MDPQKTYTVHHCQQSNNCGLTCKLKYTDNVPRALHHSAFSYTMFTSVRYMYMCRQEHMSHLKGSKGASDCVEDVLVKVPSILLPYMEGVLCENQLLTVGR